MYRVVTFLPVSLLVSALILNADQTAISKLPSQPSADHLKPPALYVLGPDDQITLQGPNADELVNKPARLDAHGDVRFPLIGSLHAGGLTIGEFERLLNQKLKVYIRNPQIVVSVSEFKSQPVSVLGAVNSPGVHQIQGQKTLVEMISLAGGLRSDAGSHITITRLSAYGPLPLLSAKEDQSGKFSTAEISIRDITAGLKPQENILVMSHDVVSVARADMIYVIGEVKKAGGFLLGEDSSMTVVQALALAEGAERTADLRKAQIIRNPHSGTSRKEISCDIRKVLSGKSSDINLQPQDILYIPGSTGKKVALRSLETAIQTGSGIAIWGIR
jgi:polysaccharide export outer membrane protein